MTVRAKEGAILVESGQLATSCGGCPYPTLLLTVTGSSGTINWCGQTWTLPADSGNQKEVCPDVYSKSKSSGTATRTTYGYLIFYTWYNAGELINLNNSLELIRGASKDFSYLYMMATYKFGTLVQRNKLSVTTATNSYFTKSSSPFGASNINSWSGLGGIISGVPWPTLNDAYLTDDFFGSWTDSGITYAWEKGEGWT